MQNKISGLAESAAQLQALIQDMQFTNEQGIKADLQRCHYDVVDVLAQAKKRGASVYLIGNGGSAAIVSHAKTDLMNVAKIKAITLLEPAMATCLSNDYGYEHVFSRQIEVLANPDDILIAVSSSGQSKNIINAAQAMLDKKAHVITLTGFNEDNPLRRMGQMNYWIDSSHYTLVEIAHLFVLHHLADCLAAMSEK